jgi:hypothetical protein
MVKRRSPWVWLSLVAGGLMAGALGVTFIVLGLEEADQLAGVVGVFVAVAGLGVSVYGVMPARRGETRSQAPSPSSAGDDLSADGGRSAAPLPAGDEGGQAAIRRMGDTHNTISGGTFHAPVTMGRDVTGPSAAQPSPPLDDQDVSE